MLLLKVKAELERRRRGIRPWITLQEWKDNHEAYERGEITTEEYEEMIVRGLSDAQAAEMRRNRQLTDETMKIFEDSDNEQHTK